MIFRISLRNIFRQKRRTILTLLALFGSITLSVISIGWSDGSYGYIIDVFTRTRLGHIQVHAKGYFEDPTLYNTIRDYPALGRKIAGVRGVAAWAPRLFAAGLASAGEKSAGIRIIGIDPALENAATGFDRKITAGRTFGKGPAHEAVLGKDLARVLNAAPGSDVVVVSQGADGSIANDVYTVAGLAGSGDPGTDRTALYLTLSDAQQLLVLENQAHEIAVIADDIDRVKETAAAVGRAAGPEYTVLTWQQFARSFYDAMRIDQEGTYITLVIILLIAAFGVLNTVLMSVLERRREYGLLKAIGTTPGQIVLLVEYEVMMLTVAAMVLGAAAGSLANYFLSIYGIRMPSSFTYGGVTFNTLYAKVTLRSISIPAVMVFVIALLVSFVPALMAARTDPAKAMRMH